MDRDRKIPTAWISHLKTKEDKDGFKDKVAMSSEVLLVLKNICTKMLMTTKSKDFENAAWPYKRAYQDGYNAALEDIKKLLP